MMALFLFLATYIGWEAIDSVRNKKAQWLKKSRSLFFTQVKLKTVVPDRLSALLYNDSGESQFTCQSDSPSLTHGFHDICPLHQITEKSGEAARFLTIWPWKWHRIILLNSTADNKSHVLLPPPPKDEKKGRDEKKPLLHILLSSDGCGVERRKWIVCAFATLCYFVFYFFCDWLSSPCCPVTFNAIVKRWKHLYSNEVTQLCFLVQSTLLSDLILFLHYLLILMGSPLILLDLNLSFACFDFLARSRLALTCTYYWEPGD